MLFVKDHVMKQIAARPPIFGRNRRAKQPCPSGLAKEFSGEKTIYLPLTHVRFDVALKKTARRLPKALVIWPENISSVAQRRQIGFHSIFSIIRLMSPLM
jgi:hypothetical protein